MKKQQELDLLEEALLTDIFGSVSADKMVLRAGLFKIDMSGRAQKAINKLEEALLPLMSDDGTLNPADLKKYINLEYCDLPEGKIRPIELYRRVSPFVKKAKEILI